MAEPIQVQALLAKLESQQVNRLQKLIALEKLTESCEHGLSADDIELIFSKLLKIKGSSYIVQLVECCLPSDDVSSHTIDVAVFLMSRPHTAVSLKRALLSWLLAGAQHFFTPATRSHLRTYYGPIFAQVEWKQMVNLACTLLCQLTELSDVEQHRVDTLLFLSAGPATDSGPLWALIRKYRRLRPDMVQQRSASSVLPRWEKPRSRLVANLERWMQRREQTPAAAAAGGDLWDMDWKVSRRAAAMPVLPESLPAVGGGEPDHWQGCRDLTSLSSLEDVAEQGALGFREANNLTSLVLSKDRRAALLLDENPELAAMKINMDLLISLRRMLVYEPRQYPERQRLAVIRQLMITHRVGVRLSVGRDLLRLLLTRARADHTHDWLPALDLLPFYGWRPHEVLRTMLLKPLEQLALTGDRHVRLHVLVVLTEYVLRLARHELPLVRRLAFPYTSETVKDEIGSVSDPALEVARITDHVVALCKKLSTTGPVSDRLNLLRATLNFYTEVTPVLLDAGVPYVPHIGKDLVYQVLLGSDVITINKLMLMFSRYREQTERVSQMKGNPAFGRVARATALTLHAAHGQIEDLLCLLYGLRKGSGGQFGGLPAEVRAQLRERAEEAHLLLHPAAVSHQKLAETQPEYRDDNSALQLLLMLLADDGLVGFTDFLDVYRRGAGRQ